MVHFKVPKVGLMKARLESGRLEVFEERCKDFGRRGSDGELVRLEGWSWMCPRLWRALHPDPRRGLANKKLLTFHTPHGEVTLDFHYFGGAATNPLTDLISLQMPKHKVHRDRKYRKEVA